VNEDEDGMTVLEPRAGEALERMLGRYTRVRLDPTPAESKRMRGVVMAEAWRRYLARTSVIGSGGRAGSRRVPFSAWTSRRVGTSVAAAVVAGLLIGSTAFASSRAGGPLYDARLALEDMTLPSDPTARLEAEIAQAQGRVADLADAVSRGDEPAVDAAASAYSRTLDDLDVNGGVPADRALAAVQFHRGVLLELLSTAPSQALGGIEEALDHSTAVINRLDDAAGGPTTGAPGGAGSGNAGGNAGDGGNPGDGQGPAGGAGNANGGASGGGQGAGGAQGGQGGASTSDSGGQGTGQGGQKGGTSDGSGQGAGHGGTAGGSNDDRTPKPAKTPAPDSDHQSGDQGSQGGDGH
jgi:hypothetical protein